MSRKTRNTSKAPKDGSVRLQCRAVEGQTVDRATLDAALAWLRERNCDRLAWSEHPAEGNKPLHYHFVARWSSTVDCIALRDLCNRMDTHSHVDKCGRFVNMVRYLRHLDSPEKTPIPAESAHYEGFPEDELQVVTQSGRDSLALVQMIADLPHGSSPVDALRVCIGAGYRPSEVSGVTRALFDLRNLLTDGGRVGVRRTHVDCEVGEAPSARPRGPVVVFDPYDPDPAFFASESEFSGLPLPGVDD